MNDQELERIGRTMAGGLRHFPERMDLDMDEQGFVSIRLLIAALKERNSRFHWIRPHHIIAIAETDAKGRYQVSGDQVRATYGHTIDLDLRLPTDDIPDELFYPSTEEETDILLETGLRPSDRRMVHLSRTYGNAHSAGSVRTDDPIILVIDAARAIEDGIVIGKAGHTVYLTDEVPSQYISLAELEEEELQ